jgi:hypothetical protein
MHDESVLHRLKPLWLSQLHRDFVAICGSHRVELPVPILQLNDSRRVYGSWQEETGILCLSTHLLRNHSWTVVLQVLKHEMAHQLVAATRRADGGPHGLAFQEACERLGVLPEFRRPGVMAVEMVEMATTAAELSDSGRRCLRRIEKLLALGRSANEHEAALAIEKATALLAKHHLQGLAEGGASRFTSVVINQRSTRIATYKKHICSILKEYFYVRVVLGELYQASCDHHWKTIELFGTRENVAVAEYCYHFLDQRLPLLWAAHLCGRRGISERLSYYLGVLRGFRERLAQQGKTVAPVVQRPEAKALMVAEGQRLDWYVGLRFPRLRTVSGRRSKVDGALYGAGREVGRQLEMRRGVSEGPGSPACLPDNLA